MEFSQGLRFPCPRSFDGSEKGFDDFAYRLRAYLSLSNSAFRALMKHAQEQPDPLDFETFEEPAKKLAAQLQNALIALCEGPAAKIVQRDEESENGFETWRLLWLRYRPLQRAKATSRMTTILEWKFDIKDFENSFNEWEGEIHRYDSEQSTPFPDEIKAGILISRTTGPLQEHLMLNTDVSTPYSQIKSTIIKYFKTGTLFHALRSKQSSSSNSGVTPMEIDAVWRFLKGKSKGKGKFKGKSKGKESKGDSKGFKGKGQGGHQGFKGKGFKGKSKGKGKSCANCGRSNHSTDQCWWVGSNGSNSGGKNNFNFSKRNIRRLVGV